MLTSSQKEPLNHQRKSLNAVGRDMKGDRDPCRNLSCLNDDVLPHTTRKVTTFKIRSLINDTYLHMTSEALLQHYTRNNVPIKGGINSRRHFE